MSAVLSVGSTCWSIWPNAHNLTFACVFFTPPTNINKQQNVVSLLTHLTPLHWHVFATRCYDLFYRKSPSKYKLYHYNQRLLHFAVLIYNINAQLPYFIFITAFNNYHHLSFSQKWTYGQEVTTSSGACEVMLLNLELSWDLSTSCCGSTAQTTLCKDIFYQQNLTRRLTFPLIKRTSTSTPSM